MSNLLKSEKSPYLLLHAENPVDWYPWGDAAFKKAKAEDKPIFLSIGYSTCHWCHVMESESFDDDEVARILNKHFVSIKVDREERPDIDMIYMMVCQAMTGRGGWPLSIFMTPDSKPFFAGTYFPKEGRMGISGFLELIARITVLWREDREQLIKVGDDVAGFLKDDAMVNFRKAPLRVETLKKAFEEISKNFDEKWGGFGKAPKFPMPHNLTFLLRWYKRSGDRLALEMVVKTLDSMRRGGIFDQIGFGFHRYSTDEKWLVPHFEQMLYDQALLAIAFVEAFQVTNDERFATSAREIFTYVLSDMISIDGGFFSAEDADTEGEEGLFYLFTPGEVKKILGSKNVDIFCRFYDIDDEGNFEDGKSIPNIKQSMDEFAKSEGIDIVEFERFIDDSRKKLHELREKRVKPFKDDKIITAWNGLMIVALAKGFQVLRDRKYLDAANDAATFVLNKLKRADGGLKRRFRGGEAAYPGFVDDYAFFVWGLIELYEAGFDINFLEEAVSINKVMLDLFWDKDNGGLFFTGTDAEKLIARKKEIYDGAMPSGNSVAASNLVRLAKITGDTKYDTRAEKLIDSFSGVIENHPSLFTQFLGAIDFVTGPSKEIVVSGDSKNPVTKEMIKILQRKYLPNKVLIHAKSNQDLKKLIGISPFLADIGIDNKKPTVFICEEYTCRAPIYDIKTLKKALK
jgi:uncharacterized protein